MAERRMIHKKISLSEQFNDMSEFAQLLFTLMIPHADDWGSLKGTARVIRGTAIPLNDTRSIDDVETALCEMETNCLIWRYEPDSEGPMLQLRKWEEHQTGLGNRTKPKNKLYYYCEDARRLLEEAGIEWDYEEFSRTSEKLSEVQKDSPLTEQNRTKQNPTEKKSAKRDTRLDHPAIIGYKDLARLHVEIALRDDWIACAEEVGTEHLVAIVKEWIGRGYKKTNVDGMMEVAREGWKDAKASQSRKGDHDRPDDYYEKALAAKQGS